MRNYKPEKYVKLVEQLPMEDFRKYMEFERKYISSIENAKKRTFIELGAGYGRVIPHIHDKINAYKGIEINSDMYYGLKQMTSKYNNTCGIWGDMIDLPQYFLNDPLVDCVVMLLQNTLGTIEGEISDLEKGIKKFFKNRSGDLVISVLKAESLSTFGVEFYKAIKPICGEIDYEKCDFEKGLFISKTGYTSQWWTKNQINDFLHKLDANIIHIEESKHFYIFHSTFGKSNQVINMI